MCGSGEYRFIRDEIKHAKKMTEGTVPVPRNRPCAERDDDVLPVFTVTTFFGELKRSR